MTADDRDVWLRVGTAGAGAVFGSAFRVRHYGLHQIPAEGGALICTNHVSVLDPVFVALGGAKRGRPVRFLGLSELFESGFVGLGHADDAADPAAAGDRGLGRDPRGGGRGARRGDVAGMSPEGRVTDGVEELAGQKGAARIALDAGRPVIPSGIWGSNLPLAEGRAALPGRRGGRRWWWCSGRRSNPRANPGTPATSAR